MATSPLTPAEYATYSVVFEDEAVSPTALAAQLSMPLTTVVDDIREMEAAATSAGWPTRATAGRTSSSSRATGCAPMPRPTPRFEVAYRAFAAALPDGEAPAQAEVAKLLGAAERALRPRRRLRVRSCQGASTVRSRSAQGPRGP